MVLTNGWYFYDSAIDKKICNKLKSIGKSSFNGARVSERRKELSDEERKTGIVPDYSANNKIRISDVSWTTEQWVIDLIWPFMLKANEAASWNFDIKSVEAIQVTKYKTNGFYGWHSDGCADCLSTYDMPENKFLHGNARKLSMTILLNDNYHGGEFQFAVSRNGAVDIETPNFKNSGSVIVFPSFSWHQVTPVTKGTRYSLVAWFVGPPFK